MLRKPPPLIDSLKGEWLKGLVALLRGLRTKLVWLPFCFRLPEDADRVTGEALVERGFAVGSPPAAGVDRVAGQALVRAS